jgi:hypothetical protein
MSEPDPPLVWAIPVDFKRFVSSLQAFRATKQTIFQFLLCNKFGQNRTLPRELLEEIAALVRAPVFEEYREHWEKMERCAENDCDKDDQ